MIYAHGSLTFLRQLFVYFAILLAFKLHLVRLFNTGSYWLVEYGERE